MKLPLRLRHIVNTAFYYQYFVIADDNACSIPAKVMEFSPDVNHLRRIVASVNALADVPLDVIESGVVADLLKREGMSHEKRDALHP
jgi:hypothetical protein